MGPGFESLEVHHLFSSIAQSVERMTVNHDVTGSSPVRGAIRTLSCTRFFFFCLVCGLEPKWHQLTSHCLLRKLTVKGRLGVVQSEITLVVLIACGISSLRPIPPRRYARVTGLSSLRGAIRTLSCTRFFFFCLHGLEQQLHQLNTHCLLRKLTVKGLPCSYVRQRRKK